jgi:hypothetical protein
MVQLKLWHKILMAVVIVVAVILAARYRQSI